MSTVSRFVPLFVIVPFCAYLGMAAIPPSDPPKGMRAKFKLPVGMPGIKPIDSFVMLELLLISKNKRLRWREIGSACHPLVFDSSSARTSTRFSSKILGCWTCSAKPKPSSFATRS